MENKVNGDADRGAFRRGSDGTLDDFSGSVAGGSELRDAGLAALRELNRAYPAALASLDEARKARADTELQLALVQDANVALQRDIATNAPCRPACAASRTG